MKQVNIYRMGGDNYHSRKDAEERLGAIEQYNRDLVFEAKIAGREYHPVKENYEVVGDDRNGWYVRGVVET